MAGEVIRIQPTGQTWETLGAARLAGIWPESIEAQADAWGPSTMDFVMKAEPGARRPDLLPYTPIDLEVDGVMCWSGFVWQRPTAQNDYAVNCKGWQYHLDDDLFDRAYVHTRLTDYQDIRSFLAADLTQTIFSGTISNDNGIVTVGWRNGDAVAASRAVGVTYDAGPDSAFTRAVIQAQTSFNASFHMYIIGHDIPYWNATVGSTRDDYVTAQLINNTPWTAANQTQTFAATIPGGRSHRYTTLLLWSNAGSAGLTADVWIKFVSVQLFRSTTYEAGNASILKSSQVVTDALTAAPLLNQAASKITAGTFSMPMFATGGYVTPRTVIEAANAVENYRTKIGGGDLKTLVYDPKPTAPFAEVGEWSGSEFSDATVTGEPIYNKAIVDGTGADGSRVVSARGNGIVLPPTTLWSLQGQTNNTVAAPAQLAIFSQLTAGKLPGGVIRAGVPYLITLVGGSAIRNPDPGTTLRIRVGGNATDSGALPPDDYVEFIDSAGGSPVGAQGLKFWIPKRNYARLVREDFVTVGGVTAGAAPPFATDITTRVSRGSSMLDRDNRARAVVAPVKSAVTAAVADRIADLFLTEHVTAPFAGTLRLVGNGARRIDTSRVIPPHEFLFAAGEKIRFANRVDPDTGVWGRDGRIAGVIYRHNDRSVEIAIDDQRQRFDTILARYAALVDG